ncbi:hypothetical protein [Nitrospira sp. Nam74]
MNSWMLLFVTYVVPAVVGLPLLLLWDRLSHRRILRYARQRSRSKHDLRSRL